MIKNNKTQLMSILVVLTATIFGLLLIAGLIWRSYQKRIKGINYIRNLKVGDQFNVGRICCSELFISTEYVFNDNYKPSKFDDRKGEYRTTYYVDLYPANNFTVSNGSVISINLEK